MAYTPSLIITTTSAVTGSEIAQYLGPVIASAEAAAGYAEPSLSVVSDAVSAAAGLPTLDDARAKAVSLLEEAAKEKGADAIIDFRVDHETMTGPNGPAVLLNASGTAVRLAGAGGGTLAAIKERAKKGGAGAAGRRAFVLGQEVINQVLRNRLIRAAEDGTLKFDDTTWSQIIRLQLGEVAPAVLRHWASIVSDRYRSQTDKEAVQARLTLYFDNLGFSEGSEYLYDALANEPAVASEIAKLIVDFGCSNFTRVLAYVTSGDRALATQAVQTLKSSPLIYERDDVHTMQELIDVIPGAFPPLPTSDVSRRLSSKPRTVWSCLCGHLPGEEDARCTKCQRDNQGFMRSDLTPDDAVYVLTGRLEALKQLLDEGYDPSGVFSSEGGASEWEGGAGHEDSDEGTDPVAWARL